MACYTVYSADRRPIGHMCGELGDHCVDCGDLGVNLCDYPVGKGKTCDRPICDHCAVLLAPEVHYCAGHAKEFEAFRESGGLDRGLENVVSIKPDFSRQIDLFRNRVRAFEQVQTMLALDRARWEAQGLLLGMVEAGLSKSTADGLRGQLRCESDKAKRRLKAAGEQ